MAQQLSNDEGSLNEVNVIPLADLSLVLLIILMVMSPMITQGIIQVAAENAQKARNQEELATPETPLIVSFKPGMLKINDTVVASEMDFVQRLRTLLGKRRDRTVMLTAAPDLVHGKVVRVMELIRVNGASNLVMLKWGAEKS
jgi:biopolymer transport protein ExbD